MTEDKGFAFSIAQSLRWDFRFRAEMGVSYPMKPKVTDELWEEIKHLLPPHPSGPRGGRPPSSDRPALEGILYVLRSGIPWELLPSVFGVCGMTC